MVDPIVVVPPILGQFIDAAVAGGGKIKSWTLDYGRCNATQTNRLVRLPFRVINSKYRGIDGPVIFVKKSDKKICPFIKRPWYLLRFQNDDVNKTEIKNSYSHSLEISFWTSDSNKSGGSLIISKILTLLCINLATSESSTKQIAFNSQNAERWPISSCSHMPLTIVPSKEAERPPIPKLHHKHRRTPRYGLLMVAF